MPCKQFRVGVFFDGTGNNKANDKVLGKESNIALLSDLYKEETITEGLPLGVCERTSKMIYIEGVGTNAGEDDYLTSRGAAMARDLSQPPISRNQIKNVEIKYEN